MEYGLLGAFKHTWDINNAQEAEPMMQQLADFLQSEKCLRWVEIATIINYSGDFPELLDNIVSVLRMLMLMHDEMALLRDQCCNFFRNWIYVVLQTTKWGHRRKKSGYRNISPEKPPGFDEDPIAQSMLHIGKSWSATFSEVLSAHVPDDSPEKKIRCSYCHKAIRNGMNSKSHLIRNCPGYEGSIRSMRRRRAQDGEAFRRAEEEAALQASFDPDIPSGMIDIPGSSFTGSSLTGM
jgi:hypothetical protein